MVSTGQAENPEIQSKVLMKSFMSADNLESVTCSLEGLWLLFTFIYQIVQVKKLSFYLQLLLCRNALDECFEPYCVSSLSVQAVLFLLETLGDHS